MVDKLSREITVFKMSFANTPLGHLLSSTIEFTIFERMFPQDNDIRTYEG